MGLLFENFVALFFYFRRRQLKQVLLRFVAQGVAIAVLMRLSEITIYREFLFGTVLCIIVNFV